MSDNSYNKDEMRSLVLAYIAAANANDKVKEEALLHQIRQLKSKHDN